MKVIHARNVHQALPQALDSLLQQGYQEDSRNGPVRRFDGPVTTMYGRPEERVLFWAQRNANPFFHLAESLWMLAGRNDVEYVARYVARMSSFSDDGKTFHGAYGYRWRTHFGFDQIAEVTAALRKNPRDRRVVMSMWDARTDLGREGRDFPCNLQAIFSVNQLGQLDMTVTNRSNDIIWGAYGANAVHFSYLQEYIARCLGIGVGRYWQVSNNFHAYVDVLEQVKELAQVPDEVMNSPYSWRSCCPYTAGIVGPFPLMSQSEDVWREDLTMYLEEPDAIGFRDPFFRRVAVPMWRTWKTWKDTRDFRLSLDTVRAIDAMDWRLAALEWIQRAHLRAQRANDDGARAAGEALA